MVQLGFPGISQVNIPNKKIEEQNKVLSSIGNIKGINTGGSAGMQQSTQSVKPVTQASKSIPVVKKSGRLTNSVNNEKDLNLAAVDIIADMYTQKQNPEYQPSVESFLEKYSSKLDIDQMNALAEAITDADNGSGENELLDAYKDLPSGVVSNIYKGIESTKLDKDKDVSWVKSTGEGFLNQIGKEGLNLLNLVVNPGDIFNNKIQKSVANSLMNPKSSIFLKLIGQENLPDKVSKVIKENGYEAINELTNKLGGNKDSAAYEIGKFVAEIAPFFTPVGIESAGSKIATKIPMIAEKAPAFAKIIETAGVKGIKTLSRLAEGVTQANIQSIATEGKVAGPGESVMGGIANVILPQSKMFGSVEKGLKPVATRVENKFFNAVNKAVDSFKNDIGTWSPYKVVQDKVDNMLENISSKKDIIGSKVGEMRKSMKTISYSIDDAVKFINNTFKDNGIAAYLAKDKKGVWKVAGGVKKSEGKSAALNEMAMTLNGMKSLGNKDKISGLDSLLKDASFWSKKTEVSEAKRALGQISKKFGDDVESKIKEYGLTKKQYSSYLELEKYLEKLAGDKGADKISSVGSKLTTDELRQISLKAKELGITDTNLLDEILIANKIIKTKLSPTEIDEAVRNIYPSIPGTIEFGIKSGKGFFGGKAGGLKKLEELTQGYKGIKDLSPQQVIKATAKAALTQRADKTDKKQ